MYPEDSSIRCSRLIGQSIVEGFVRLNKDKTLDNTDRISKVRTILNFNSIYEILNNSISSTFTKNFKLLNVLDFQDGALDNVHKDIGYLFHLRYLSL